MSKTLNAIWMGSQQIPEKIVKAVGVWNLSRIEDGPMRISRLNKVDIALVDFRSGSELVKKAPVIFAELMNTRTAGGFIVDSPQDPICETIRIQQSPFVCIPSGANSQEVLSLVTTAVHLGNVIFHLHHDLSKLKNSNEHANGELENFGQEMQLASRLQRDFLPSRLPEIGPVRFSVLFDPYSFVSGDIYDVTRLDEKTLGFYIADAVGHGMPAALLTMFIKNSLLQKHITANSYRIVPPNESLKQLNEDLCSQELENSQFCTAVYATLNVENMQLTYCRAGHPEPILIHQNGNVEMMKGRGTLLGIVEEAEFESQTVQLQPGDRVIIYTDGLEDSLKPEIDSNVTLCDMLAEDMRIPRDVLLMNLTSRLQQAQNENKVNDDVTVLIMDVER